MDFLKKNYEKVLLGAVLIGLAVAVAFLPFKIASEKEKLEEMERNLLHPKIKPLPALDMAPEDNALKLMATPATISFSAPNRLFNPMLWQKAADGHLIKADSTNIGPYALVMTKMTPLYLKLSFDSMTVLDSGSRYAIGVEKEASTNAADRRKRQTYGPVGTSDKEHTFTLRDAKAAPDNATNVTVNLELTDSGEHLSLTNGQTFKRVDGYMIDLKYPPENKTFNPGRRVGDELIFNGEKYKIVAISDNELVLSATSNQKKWTVKLTKPAS